MSTPLVVIFMGSQVDLPQCEKIEKALKVRSPGTARSSRSRLELRAK